MKKVLIVEDDHTIRKTIVAALKTSAISFVTFECSNGQAAFDLLIENPDIDLLITDIRLPGLDGRDLLRKIREHSELSGLPVLMISGVVSLKEIAALLEFESTLFMPKPLEAKDLRVYAERLVRARVQGCAKQAA